MAVAYRCPNIKCSKILHVPINLRGKNVRCSYCGTIHGVPRAEVLQKKLAKKKKVKTNK